MALFLLVVAAGVFYIASRVQESSSVSRGELVFRPDPVPMGTVATGSPATGPAAHPEEAAVETAATAGLPDRTSGQEAPASTEARFDAFRIERSQGRSRRIEALQESLRDASLPPAQREAMREELLALIEQMELEQEIEGMLVARGLTDAVVVLREHSAEVVVSDVLDREEASRVGDLVARMGGVPLEGIVIVDGAATR